MYKLKNSEVADNLTSRRQKNCHRKKNSVKVTGQWKNPDIMSQLQIILKFT